MIDDVKRKDSIALAMFVALTWLLAIGFFVLSMAVQR
jgi:hypothetical protein